MHILVTNDDGVYEPGLLALVQSMRKVGSKVSVLAPDHNWSAAGHVKTLHRPLRVKPALLADGSEAWKTDGAPSDCVALAEMGFLEDKIDLVVSGINPNENIGHDVTYSGTVTAAMEASIRGIPGIAVSLHRPEGFTGTIDYHPAAETAGRIAAWLQDQAGMPEDLILNINIPYGPVSQLRGYKITRLGHRIYRDVLMVRDDPRGKPYYWIGGEAPTGTAETGTDFGALTEGYVSITPISLDMTCDKAGAWLNSKKFEMQLSAK